MSDLPSALGIEAVELAAEGGRSVTVRVTGRWRRRRPELRGQAMLVVETGTVRQRFVAMPEPPSLMGAAPGTWRLAFAVPAELAPQLAGRTFLQYGAVMVPLPVGELGGPEGGEDPETADREHSGPELLEARQLRSLELAAESARRRAAEAEPAAAELNVEVARVEDELALAREEADRLRDDLTERDRRLRSSEQHVHAERARRTEVEQALIDKTRAAGHDLKVLHDHVADLERDLNRMRRAVDEAEHLAAAAKAGRADAERRLAERPPPPAPEPAPTTVDAARVARTVSELALSRATTRRAPPAMPAPRSAPSRAADREALRLESAMVEHRAAGLERELAVVRYELLDARRDLERQRLLSERAYDAIDQVRGELARLGASAPATEAPQPSAPVGPVQAEKLSAALARLRETMPAAPAALEMQPAPTAGSPTAGSPTAESPTAESPTAPTRPAKPWLGKAFRALASRDPSSAGRLLLALLPAQRAADPRPIAYDLVLGDLAAARVTVSSTGAQVDLGDTPRPLTEVDFQLVGDLASIARLLAAGPARRRLGRVGLGGRMARIRGDRGRLGALEHLIDAQLTLAQLRAAGVRLDPVLALTLAGLMIEPGWTGGERFTIAHLEPEAASPDAYLHIRDLRAPMTTDEPPHGPVATTIGCAPDDLLGVLTGEKVAFVAISGDRRPLTLVSQWLDRAQCG